MKLQQEHYKLLAQYINTHNDNIDDINRATNLLTQLKFSTSISFESLTSVKLLKHTLKVATNVKMLHIDFISDYDVYSDFPAIKDESLKLNKLESLEIFNGFRYDNVLTQLMKRMDLEKITCIALSRLSHVNLQIFETHSFPNLTSLTLTPILVQRHNRVDDCLIYLSNLTQLIKLEICVGLTINNWNWLSKLTNLEIVYLSWAHPLPDQAQSINTLARLPKLRELEIRLEILDSTNKYLQLFSQFKSLTLLSIISPSGKIITDEELKLIQFPTIPTLTTLAFTDRFHQSLNSQHAVPILMSNPQLQNIGTNILRSFSGCFGVSLRCLTPSKQMLNILEYAPSLLEYNFTKVDMVIECCEMNPKPLITQHKSINTSDDKLSRKRFITDTSRIELKQHLQQNYECTYCKLKGRYWI